MAIPEMTGPIGANANLTHTAVLTGGGRADGKDGSEWVYVHADGAIVAYDVVLIHETWEADQLDLTNSGSAFGQKVGVAAVAFADNAYGWVQVNGVCDNIGAAASCAANVSVHSTAGAGLIDDAGTVGAETINGLALTTAETGSAGSAPGILSHPTVGVTL